MELIKVLIVDDHKMFGESLSFLLSAKGKVNVIGIASNGEDALMKIERLRPNIVLMDIEMKGLDGIEMTSIIKKKYPEIEIIIITMHTEEEYLLEALKAGAKGYVLKNFSSPMILDAIESVTQGGIFLGHKSDGRISEPFRSLLNDKSKQKNKEILLGRRELEILKLIADGCTNKEISEKLFLSNYKNCSVKPAQKQ
jgi:DNA-binding NarL/FixJ family response regulator